jgi:hypothetical protein
LVGFGQRRVVELEVNVEAGSYQTITDGAQPVGTLRMVGAHVVLPAVAVGYEGGSCHDGGLA